MGTPIVDYMEMRIYVDAYCYWHGMVEVKTTSDTSLDFEFIEEPKFSYIEYWKWFWEHDDIRSTR